MSKTFITLYLATLILSSFQEKKSKINQVRIIVFKQYERPPGSSTFRKLMPTDSIFYNNYWAIEKLTAIQQSELNNSIKISDRFCGYYLIDLANKKYRFTTNLDSLNNSFGLRWQSPVTKMGACWEFKIYHNEKISQKDTIYNGQKKTLVRFVNSEGSQYSAILGRRLEEKEWHFYDLELKFGRRLNRLAIQTRKGGEAFATIEETAFYGKHLMASALHNQRTD